MKIISSLLAILPFFLAINAGPSNSTHLSAGAVYVMNNSPSGNFILSAAIGFDGKLTLGSATSTQGLGAAPIPFGDTLASQNSILVAGTRLYAVNPGSNTITTLSINIVEPTKLSIVGKPVSSGGDFPVSVGVSPITGQVCVVNGGAINGVNCYRPDAVHGLVEIPGTNRLLNQTLTPTPLGIFGQESQAVFSEDGTVLYAVVKGNPLDPTQPGFIAAWSVNLVTGALSQTFTKSVTTGGGLPFAMVPIPGTNAMILPDVVEGFDILDFPTPLGVATSTGFQIPNQIASCWCRQSPKTKNFYLADFGTGNITEVNVNTKTLQPTIVKQYALGVDALIDEEIIASVDGNDYLYVLAGGTSSVAVLNLEAPGKAPLIQSLDLTPLAINGVVLNLNFTQGIAAYVL